MRALRLMRWIAFAGIALFLAAIVVFEFAPGVREFALSPSGGAVIKPRSLKGHQDAFLRRRLSARYRFSEETLARTLGNGRDAPIADLAAHAREVSNCGRLAIRCRASSRSASPRLNRS
jgi:hypothetical protein